MEGRSGATLGGSLGAATGAASSAQPSNEAAPAAQSQPSGVADEVVIVEGNFTQN